MKLRTIFLATVVSLLFTACSSGLKERVGLTLIPPGTITNQVDLDIRAGVVNNSEQDGNFEVAIYLNKKSKKNLLQYSQVPLKAGESYDAKYILETEDKVGENKILLEVKNGCKKYSVEKAFKVVESNIRSTRLIEGAWMGLYHWSEQEGKHWNKDIRKMTHEQWAEMVRAMHAVGMDIIVIQEVFRNQEYVGQHSLTVSSYAGRAFYESNLYEGRMPTVSQDALGAIMEEADKLGMHVMMGVGMFAWFDFTEQSLLWHKKVAKELWEKYGAHPSFYGFYISEECAGNLFNSEITEEGKLRRKKEITDFFREFKRFTHAFAPEKPVMLATNSMDILDGKDAYPGLLQNLDILCPFGFARMPENDLTGKEAADLLQRMCDDAGSHLWFDLEAFLFNPDMSLYPRPIAEIIYDLNLFDNFEKVLCYQFPGVFNSSEMSIRVGEERTLKLYSAYKDYFGKTKK